jgi:hypothetical protein
MISNYLSKCLWHETPGFYSLTNQDARRSGRPGNTTTQNYASRSVTTGENQEIFLVFSSHAGGFGGEISISTTLVSIGKDRFLLTRTPWGNEAMEPMMPGVPVGYVILPPDIPRGKWVSVCELAKGVTLSMFIHGGMVESVAIRLAETRSQVWGVQ